MWSTLILGLLAIAAAGIEAGLTSAQADDAKQAGLSIAAKDKLDRRNQKIRDKRANDRELSLQRFTLRGQQKRQKEEEKLIEETKETAKREVNEQSFSQAATRLEQPQNRPVLSDEAAPIRRFL
jgi:hypothetical protein